LRVIAEGIETEAQLEFVRALRCDQAQGFLFHSPMPRGDLMARIAEQETPLAAGSSRVVSIYRGT
jgi:EAL domain-containing protein (putative c-di-GMP-specific phosphodiesterase class I)